MNIAVLGAGPRAREIARACVLGGESVRLHTSDATAVMDSIDIVERELDGSDAHEASLEGTTGLDAALADVDVVIETTLADERALQERFSELESLVEARTVLATTVPGVSVTAAATGLHQPGRVVGFRFHDETDSFVEVVFAEQTDEASADRATALARAVAGEWATVRDTPGAVAKRLSLALEIAAIRMLDEGIADVEAIDGAFKHAYQAAIGPLERADRVGLDTRHEELLSLSERLGGRFDPPPVLTALVEDGQTGLDAGKGFYVWEEGEPTGGAIPDPVTPADSDRDRLE